MDAELQIHNWLGGAQYDLDSAEVMYEEGRNAHCMTFCSHCIIKMLKAYWVRCKIEYPPRNDRPLYLAKHLELELTEEQLDLLALLSVYTQLPEDIRDWKALRVNTKREVVGETFEKTERFIEWIKPKLRK